MKIKEILTKAQNDGVPYWFITKDGAFYSDIYAADYSDNEMAKIVCNFRKTMIKGNFLPIGLIEVYVPYENIVCVQTPKIEDGLLSKVPDEIKKKFNSSDFYIKTQHN